MKIICIPHAGGSAYSFSNLKRIFSDFIEVIPIELPGRGKLIDKPLTSDPSEALAVLREQLKNSIESNEKYILFGHSLGAWLAYILCCELKKEKGYTPCHLVLSGNNPLFVPKQVMSPNDYDDKSFLEIIGKCGGIPDQLLKSKGLMEYYIGVLRADYQLIYHLSKSHNQMNTVDCDVSVMNASDDQVTDDSINEWQMITSQKFDLFEYKGSHFTLLEKVISEDLISFFKDLKVSVNV